MLSHWELVSTYEFGERRDTDIQSVAVSLYFFGLSNKTHIIYTKDKFYNEAFLGWGRVVITRLFCMRARR